MARKKDSAINLTKEQKKYAIPLVKDYLEQEFEIEVGQLQAELFLDYISEKVGVFHYNQAVQDTIAVMTEKVDELYLMMKEEKS